VVWSAAGAAASPPAAGAEPVWAGTQAANTATALVAAIVFNRLRRESALEFMLDFSFANGQIE
jgi:hypothetical protein